MGVPTTFDRSGWQCPLDEGGFGQDCGYVDGEKEEGVDGLESECEHDWVGVERVGKALASWRLEC